ncbi:Hvo_1808 family surface protein [Natronorubrum sp. FCH18a]|uniref:Hvo_1808 family surface protein n=1 Tax=Natronorubrum sp. FCH18a TaxID=3447018 RepID=UPI003F50EC39
MTATLTRTRVLAALVAVSMLALLFVAASGAVPLLPPGDSADRPDDPSTEDTVGYVEGYWYDDELAVDDRDDATIEDEDELEAVVYRSMARVEQIRGLTFEDDVPVDVVSRGEFQEDDDELFVELSEDDQLKQNVTYEALFMVDSETDAEAELEVMYGDSVGGYYDPATNEIVLVSDSPESPEVDEVILGHELVHALQDQHFDLTSYDRETIDQDNAKNGLVEGDAVTVETEYDRNCGTEWDCLPDTDAQPTTPDDMNWGIYTMLIHPYDEGPEYVDFLLEADEGWSAVNAAYDDPPQHSAAVIHPDEGRESADVSVEDESDDSWEPFEVEGEVATETVGEAGMVAMFGGDPLDPSQPSVIENDEFLTPDFRIDYDQPYTDGWAGDELVTYVDSDAAANGTPGAEETGFVWRTEWTSSEDAEQFADGYRELLEINDAEAVDDRDGLYEIDDAYPGAYAVRTEGETVTIVRAPSVDELDGIAAGVTADSEASTETNETDGTEETDATESEGSDGAADDDSIPGFAAPGAAIAIAVALLAARRRN